MRAGSRVRPGPRDLAPGTGAVVGPRPKVHAKPYYIRDVAGGDLLAGWTVLSVMNIVGNVGISSDYFYGGKQNSCVVQDRRMNHGAAVFADADGVRVGMREPARAWFSSELRKAARFVGDLAAVSLLRGAVP